MGRSAIALSTVEEIKVKKPRRPLPQPLPAPIPEPQWTQQATYEAQYQTVDDEPEEEYEPMELEAELELEPELPDSRYQDELELEDFWGDRDRQTAVRR